MLLVNIQICNYPFQGAIHSKPSLKGTIIWFHVTTVDTNSNLPSTSLPNATIAAAFGFLLDTCQRSSKVCSKPLCIYTSVGYLMPCYVCECHHYISDTAFLFCSTVASLEQEGLSSGLRLSHFPQLLIKMLAMHSITV